MEHNNKELQNQIRIQILKGILPIAVLSILKEKDAYGYLVQSELKEAGFLEFSEAAIYATLKRLYESGDLVSYVETSGEGPNRKYYGISKNGIERLKNSIQVWSEVSVSLQKLIKENK